jgi:PII-like signaling protein
MAQVHGIRVGKPLFGAASWTTAVGPFPGGRMDSLKLTAYFEERQRNGGRFLTDAMLDVYEQRNIATSIVLRGIGGFGPRHHLRSDASLSLSEDPPVAVVAVDTKATIEGLFGPLRAMRKRALITLERAQMFRGEAGPTELAGALHGTTKLTIYLGRRERVHGAPGYLALCDLLYRRGMDGASAFLGVDGTAHGSRERARFFGGNADVPVMVIAVGGVERVVGVLPELRGLLRRPLITVERVRVCKRDGELMERPHELPGTDEHGLALWQKLMVYTSEADRHDGVPIHRALIQRLRQHKSSNGATILRSVWGFHGSHPPHGDQLFRLTRRVPVVTIIADTPANIAASFDVVDELTGSHGLVTSEVVPALVSVDGEDRYGGTDLARHR